MGRILVNDDELFDAIDYLILLNDSKAEYHAMQLFVYARNRLVEELQEYEVYAKKVMEEK